MPGLEDSAPMASYWMLSDNGRESIGEFSSREKAMEAIDPRCVEGVNYSLFECELDTDIIAGRQFGPIYSVAIDLESGRDLSTDSDRTPVFKLRDPGAADYTHVDIRLKGSIVRAQSNASYDSALSSAYAKRNEYLESGQPTTLPAAPEPPITYRAVVFRNTPGGLAQFVPASTMIRSDWAKVSFPILGGGGQSGLTTSLRRSFLVFEDTGRTEFGARVFEYLGLSDELNEKVG